MQSQEPGRPKRAARASATAASGARRASAGRRSRTRCSFRQRAVDTLGNSDRNQPWSGGLALQM